MARPLWLAFFTLLAAGAFRAADPLPTAPVADAWPEQAWFDPGATTREIARRLNPFLKRNGRP